MVGVNEIGKHLIYMYAYFHEVTTESTHETYDKCLSADTAKFVLMFLDIMSYINALRNALMNV